MTVHRESLLCTLGALGVRRCFVFFSFIFFGVSLGVAAPCALPVAEEGSWVPAFRDKG